MIFMAKSKKIVKEKEENDKYKMESFYLNHIKSSKYRKKNILNHIIF